MARKPIFTLVNRPEELTPDWTVTEAKIARGLASRSEESASRYKNLPDALRRSLSSTVAPVSTKASMKRGSATTSEIERLVSKLGNQNRVATVGLLDLGAWVTGLPKLLEVLNDCQSRFVFLEVQTPVPAGLVKEKENLVAWAEKQLGKKKLARTDRSDLGRNMLADEFMYFGKSARESNGLDTLIGLTSAMIAFLKGQILQWNYYAFGTQNVGLVSTCDLREFAKDAGRPYEAAIGMLIVGQLLALRNSELEYHPETRGCVFDFNEARSDLIVSIRAMRIEKQCVGKILDPKDREAAIALIKALSRLKG